jgi:putative hydrolase of the HAD superfamily
MARLNVVFDFGAVLFTWQPSVLVREVFASVVHTDAQAVAVAKDIFSHPDWQAFDAGRVSQQEVIQRTQARTGLALAQLTSMIDSIGQRLAPIASSLDVLRGLHAQRSAGQDIGLYFLSNMPEPYARVLESSHEFLSWFDDGIFSGDVKLIKPDAAIYALADQRFALRGNTVFVDDMQANIDACQAHGWHGVHLAQPHLLPELLGEKLSTFPT